MGTGKLSTYVTETLFTSALNEHHKYFSVSLTKVIIKAKMHTMLQRRQVQHVCMKTNFIH